MLHYLSSYYPLPVPCFFIELLVRIFVRFFRIYSHIYFLQLGKGIAGAKVTPHIIYPRYGPVGRFQGETKENGYFDYRWNIIEKALPDDKISDAVNVRIGVNKDKYGERIWKDSFIAIKTTR